MNGGQHLNQLEIQILCSFIEDLSKFTWVYFLTCKSDVERVFLQFQNHVERMFGAKITSMQTDWGGEYQKLHKIFSNVGIKYRVSCPHTHQQKGSAERKHRHIVEVGLALLAQASMAVKFWDESFTTSCYLINRLPSRVINNSTSLERLFGSKPDYSLLKVFGCACWPHLRPYNSHKLSFRSKQSVFLGYSSYHKGCIPYSSYHKGCIHYSFYHKGYKFLHVPTGCVYISRDVIFDELEVPK